MDAPFTDLRVESGFFPAVLDAGSASMTGHYHGTCFETGSSMSFASGRQVAWMISTGKAVYLQSVHGATRNRI